MSNTHILVFRVVSGLDAFILRYGDEKIFLPYIDIVAKTEQDACEKVATMLGMSLHDQDTNPKYENYIWYDNVQHIYHYCNPDQFNEQLTKNKLS